LARASAGTPQPARRSEADAGKKSLPGGDDVNLARHTDTALLELLKLKILDRRDSGSCSARIEFYLNALTRIAPDGEKRLLCRLLAGYERSPAALRDIGRLPPDPDRSACRH
jgi:hypothetical protein